MVRRRRDRRTGRTSTSPALPSRSQPLLIARLPLLPVLACAFALGILLGGSEGVATSVFAAGSLACGAAVAAFAWTERLRGPTREAIESAWSGLPAEADRDPAAPPLRASEVRADARVLRTLREHNVGWRRALLVSLTALAILFAGAAMSRPGWERRHAVDAWVPLAAHIPQTWEAVVVSRGSSYRADEWSVVVDDLRLVSRQPGAERTDATRGVGPPGRARLALGEPGSLANRLVPGATIRFDAVLRPRRQPGGFGGERPAAPVAATDIVWNATVPIGRLSGIDAFTFDLGSRFSTWGGRVRDKLATIFDRAAGSVPSPEAAATLRAMVAGDTTALPGDLRAAFGRTGMAHLLAVSGLHASLLAVVVLLLGRAAGLDPRPLAALVTVTLLAYPLVTGGRPPIIRAVIMTGAILIPWVWGRRVPSGNALALAALVMLAVDPSALFLVSFQLSFVAVLSIVVLVPRLNAAFAPKVVAHRGRLRYATTWILARVIVQPTILFGAIALGLAPLLALHTSQVSLLGNLGNLLAVPLASVVVALGFLASLVAPFSERLAIEIAIPAAMLADVLIVFVRWCGDWPLASIVTAAPSLAVTLLYYVLLFGVPWAPLRPEMPWTVARTRGALIWRLPWAVALFLIFAPMRPANDAAPGAPPGYVYGPGVSAAPIQLTLLDVGQGDATLIEFAGGTTILIDGGPATPDAGRWVVLPYLAEAGIRRLDVVIVTHGDADHLGGLASLLEAMPVGMIADSGRDRDSEVFDAYERAARGAMRRGARRVTLGRGDVLHAPGGARLFVLGPERTGGDPLFGDDDADNEASIVLLLDHGAFEGLLPGDAGTPTERDLLARGWLRDLDYMTAGHHGSNGSTGAELLSLVRPELVGVSAGRNNRYGHPAPETLARLERAGAAIWRTDQLGTLRLAIRPDGRVFVLSAPR